MSKIDVYNEFVANINSGKNAGVGAFIDFGDKMYDQGYRDGGDSGDDIIETFSDTIETYQEELSDQADVIDRQREQINDQRYQIQRYQKQSIALAVIRLILGFLAGFGFLYWLVNRKQEEELAEIEDPEMKKLYEEKMIRNTGLF